MTSSASLQVGDKFSDRLKMAPQTESPRKPSKPVRARVPRAQKRPEVSRPLRVRAELPARPKAPPARSGRTGALRPVPGAPALGPPFLGCSAQGSRGARAPSVRSQLGAHSWLQFSSETAPSRGVCTLHDLCPVPALRPWKGKAEGRAGMSGAHLFRVGKWTSHAAARKTRCRWILEDRDVFGCPGPALRCKHQMLVAPGAVLPLDAGSCGGGKLFSPPTLRPAVRRH